MAGLWSPMDNGNFNCPGGCCTRRRVPDQTPYGVTTNVAVKKALSEDGKILIIHHKE